MAKIGFKYLITAKDCNGITYELLYGSIDEAIAQNPMLKEFEIKKVIKLK